MGEGWGGGGGDGGHRHSDHSLRRCLLYVDNTDVIIDSHGARRLLYSPWTYTYAQVGRIDYQSYQVCCNPSRRTWHDPGSCTVAETFAARFTVMECWGQVQVTQWRRAKKRTKKEKKKKKRERERDWLVRLNAGLSRKRYWRGPGSQEVCVMGGGGGGGELGTRTSLLYVHRSEAVS